MRGPAVKDWRLAFASVFGDFFDMEDLEIETWTEGGEFAIEQDGVQTLELVNLGLLRRNGRQVVVTGHVTRAIGGEPAELMPPDGIPQKGEVIPDHGRVVIAILPEKGFYPDFLTGVESGLLRRKEILVLDGSVNLGVEGGRLGPELAAGTEAEQAEQEQGNEPAGPAGEPEVAGNQGQMGPQG